MQKWLCSSSLLLLSALLSSGCKGKGSEGDGDGGEATSTTQTLSVESFDAGPDAQPGQAPQVAALDQVTPVMSLMEWLPKDPAKATGDRAAVVRLGYVRRGQILPVKAKVTKKANCTEGWYELLTGGFVCGKHVTPDLKHKDLANAPHPPYPDRALPYDYGLNLTNGTPLYRRRPLKKERAELEKGLQVGKSKSEDEAKPASAKPGDPWYLKKHNGQRPQVTIDELRTNEQGGLVVFRMVRGFYLGLDQQLSTPSGRFWRTTAGFLVPSDHVLVHKPTTEFEGVRIGAPGEARHLPLGWVTSPRARRYYVDGPPESPERVRRGDPIDRFTIVQLTGKRSVYESRAYYETDEGFWIRDLDTTQARPGPPPKDLAPGEKWIDVNLSTQSLVAFEGDRPVYATIVSTGRHDDEDKSKDHRTVQGAFTIREKHVAATMEDDGASDGPYSIQDVPWIMYFEGSYALHGAFWHSRFGHERSHGCVNMTPHDARQIFEWAGPTLPAGWHGVKATKENPGTRVIVHE